MRGARLACVCLTLLFGASGCYTQLQPPAGLTGASGEPVVYDEAPVYYEWYGGYGPYLSYYGHPGRPHGSTYGGGTTGGYDPDGPAPIRDGFGRGGRGDGPAPDRSPVHVQSPDDANSGPRDTPADTSGASDSSTTKEAKLGGRGGRR